MFDDPMNKVRQVFLYKNYFFDFFRNQKQKVRDKITWTLKLIETLHQLNTYSILKALMAFTKLG